MADVGIWEPQAPEPPTARTLSLFEDIGRDALLGLALFLPVPLKRRFSGDVRVTLCALLVLLGLTFVVDYVDAGRGAVFQRWGLYALCATLFAKLTVFLMLAMGFARIERLAHLLAGVLAVEIGGVVVYAVVHAFESQIANTILAYVVAAVAARVVFRELDVNRLRRAIAALIALAALAGLVACRGPAVPVVVPSPVKRPALDVESIYYDQPRLVQAALDGVLVSQDGVPETYFVGFASSAKEDVFENEVKHVESLFRERLGAEGRTAVLVNSRNTMDELPLANGPNLESILQGIAGKMGPEDLLFLHMTSHGSKDHKFSVLFESMRLNDLSAKRLGEIVNGAGLPWRVVVVSACFSGGYIEELKSPRAMVITAASADRTSFGCENGREYTYFGAAYYRDSLTDGDYRAAFERAVPLVREREESNGYKHSDPQIWVGEEMVDKLPLDG
ncbi:MAG: hypothetical protein OXU77_02330 [Gammaproteobacteria bacterium]|nr:hypothetical protein [Gammaproteobacteria bacterium]MDE0444566.1 hypothetical protein [Gammaproteobacteria bacterium]